MFNAIYLEPKQVPNHLRMGYNGKKFKAVIGETVTLSATYWEGGTKSEYFVLDLVTGKVKAQLGAGSSPFGKDYNGKKVTINKGEVIIERSTYCGKDGGLTFYVLPENSGKFLPDSSETLTDAEYCLLEATASLKSSYAGRLPRVDMMHANGFSTPDIQEAKQSLIEKGYLRKNGAITPKGRNNRPERGRFRRW